ncbi:CBM96 family carbohydrate-binding protein, partial [Rathayibacter sp. VKM Ac-2754]|uniref:CBM96 family carbohydrate-binding protein n=1 Tax=Rathayibacter sp. VKM Ac-2754 TaxID=2609251 RepID=UPI001358142F
VTVVDTARLRVYAEADSYVQSSTPDTNYGTQYGMLAKPSVNGTPDRLAYLRFDLSALAGKTITSAILNAETVISDTGTGPSRLDAHTTSGTWNETTLSYTNKPALGATVGSLLAENTKKYQTGDLTDYITTYATSGAGKLTLGITQDNPTSATARLITISTKESSKPAYIDITIA